MIEIPNATASDRYRVERLSSVQTDFLNKHRENGARPGIGGK
jgi:hypothetical protein